MKCIISMLGETNLVVGTFGKAFQKNPSSALKMSRCLAALGSWSLEQVLGEAAARVLTVFCPPDSENSYTLSCGVPMQHGKAQPRRNSTLPSCSGGCCPACSPFLWDWREGMDLGGLQDIWLLP